MTRLEFVERGDPHDLEPGALCWSRTVTHGNDMPAGGVVYEVVRVDHSTGEFLDDPTVRVVRWDQRGAPYLWDMPMSDVDGETMTFFARACDVEAQKLHRWLGKLSLKERRNAGMWATAAASYALLAVGGLYTPQAELRYQEGSRARRDAQRQDGAPMVDVQAKVDELKPKLEAAIEEARARRATK